MDKKAIFKNIYIKYNINLNLIFLILLFFLFLFPFSFKTSQGGISANYLFVLFSIFVIVFRGYFIKPSRDIYLIFIFYVLLYFIFTLLDIYNNDIYLRRTLSFLVFISIFSFSFIRISKIYYDAFFASLLFLALYLCIHSIYTYFLLGGEELGWSAKAILGTSRYGFVYTFVIFYILLNKYNLFFKSFFIPLLTIGCFLTYSRSSFLALFLTAILLITTYIFSIFKNKSKKQIIKILISIFIGIIIVNVILYNFFYNVYYYYFFRGFLLLFDLHGEEDGFNIFNYKSSEGYRFMILNIIIDYLNYKNNLGTGFLGIWYINLPEYVNQVDGTSIFIGSAHSQYFDLLLRTGYLGFVLFLYIILKILVFYYNYNIGIFWGLLSVLIYSFFHETFKLSYGAFIISFLISIYSNDYYLNEKTKNSS